MRDRQRWFASGSELLSYLHTNLKAAYFPLGFMSERLRIDVFFFATYVLEIQLIYKTQLHCPYLCLVVLSAKS